MQSSAVEARDAGDAALRGVQEVRRRAERARHRAIVQRDQAHRADLRQPRLSLGLERQAVDAIRVLEALPVRLVRHLLVGRQRDRVAQLGVVERAAIEALRAAGVERHRRSCDAYERLAGRHARARSPAAAASPSPSTARSNGARRNNRPGSNVASMPPAISSAAGCARSRDVRQREVVAQRHAGRRDADDVPIACEPGSASSACSGVLVAGSSDRRPRRRDPASGGSPRGAKRRAAARGTCTRRNAGRTGRSATHAGSDSSRRHGPQAFSSACRTSHNWKIATSGIWNAETHHINDCSERK